MKKILLRVGAFVIDMLICIVITVLLGQISLINPKNSEVAVLYQELSIEGAKYDSFIDDVEAYFKDGELVEEELTKIKTDYDTYSILFEGVNVKEEITNKKKDEIRGKIQETYINKINNINYKISKANVYQSVISFVVYILYLGVVQWLMKGQTLGKKLFKLKVVNKNDIDKKVPLWNYLLRAVFVSELLLIGTDLILAMVLDLNPYLTANYWISNLRYIYEMAFLIVLIIRDDQRSVHDLLLNTRVALFDKSGNEVKDVLFLEEDEKEEETKEEKKDIKKSTKKNVKEVKFDDKKKSNKTNKNVSKNASK